MAITFKQLELHNYLPFKDATLDLENRGVILIEGRNLSNNSYSSNGSAKSSLLSGVTYALYGKTIEGVSGDAVINNKVGTDCHVFLTLDKDGTAYRIERYRKGKKGNANKVRLYANDDEITPSKASLTNQMIESLLGFDFATYVNTVAYGQGDEPIFSQATDKGKKEILENLANISIYADALKVAKDKSTSLVQDMTTTQAELSNLASKEQTITSYANQQEAQQQEAKRREADDRQTLANLDQEIAKTETELTRAKQAWEEAKVATQQVIKDNPIPSATDANRKAQEMYSQLSSHKSTQTQAAKQVKQLIKQVTDAANATNCPMCGAPLDEQHRVQEVTRLKQELQQQADLYKTETANVTELTPQYEAAQSTLSAFDQQVQTARTAQSAAQASERSLERSYTNLVHSKDMQLKQREQLLNASYEVSSVDYSKDLEEIAAKTVALNDKLADLVAENDAYTTLVNDVFSRKGVPSMALDLVVPFLNDHTNYYLAKLSGSILKVNMSAQTLNANKSLSDKFDIQVTNEAGANSYQSCSTGEKKRIDLAIAFAIQDLQNSKSSMATNIAIYDECFDGLDAVGAESVIELLKEKSKTLGSIFVITHNDTLKPFFDDVITVEKGVDGISRVVANDPMN